MFLNFKYDFKSASFNSFSKMKIPVYFKTYKLQFVFKGENSNSILNIEIPIQYNRTKG